MTDREYDQAIAEHYRAVAETDGLSSSSTMADEITREIETESIDGFVADVVARTNAPVGLRILEVGCGNGYTLDRLASRFEDAAFVGVEKSDELRALAAKRIADGNLKNATVEAGDIRDEAFAGSEPYDVLICQRVLINLLDPGDQKQALTNLVASVKPGGGLIFIEAFQSGLDRINEARAEFGLPAIPPAHHNLYLTDDFFAHPHLDVYESEGWSVPPNVFSTHYFVSRVFFPIVLGDRPFKRNTAFVKFFSQALKPAVGDFTQLQVLAFTRRT